MENEIIMNEEVMEDVIEPAVETAESYCHRAAKSSRGLTTVGVVCAIGAIAAGVVIFMKRRKKKAETDNAAPSADAPYIIDVEDDDEQND